MPDLRKASLRPIGAEADPQPLGDPIPVQFNPSSLRLAIAGRSDARATPARQAEQSLGSGNTTLTLDLHFDTADEGTTREPRTVREKTKQVAQFITPAPGSSAPPPRVRFQWGDFIVDGVMGSYTEDIDLFSSQGVPLRAKVSISIRGQNADLAANRSGPGQNDGAGATPPGGGGLGLPGTAGIGGSLALGASLSAGASLSLGAGAGIGLGAGLEVGAGLSTEVAIGGESVAEFAARVGADPEAWRAIAGGLESSLSLEAGTEIDFSVGLSASGGVGSATGIETAAAAPLDAAVGLAGERAAPARTGAAPGTAAGLALASAGGVQAAVETVRAAEAGAAAASAQDAFASGARSAAPPAAPFAPPAAQQPRPPLRIETPGGASLPVAAARREPPPAPRPVQVDARAVSFGFGVPLRPRVTGAAEERAGAVGGAVLVGVRARSAVAVPTAQDPTDAPWLALPASDAGRRAADAAQGRVRPGCACGCAGGGHADCGCGCGGSCA
jgi:Contractile injection system tube protein